MSRAFVKEADSSVPESLPELEISEEPNFVTARGLALIERTIEQLEAERLAAKQRDDDATALRCERDLRYWLQRKSSAQPVVPEPAPQKVRFGVTAWLALADGSERKYTLVGEDEADPRHGLISWLSPVAQSLLGREVGDEVTLTGQKTEIVKLDVEQ